MVELSLALLFPGFGSVALDDTVAVLLSVPVAELLIGQVALSSPSRRPAG